MENSHVSVSLLHLYILDIRRYPRISGRRLWFGLKSSPCLCLSSYFYILNIRGYPRISADIRKKVVVWTKKLSMSLSLFSIFIYWISADIRGYRRISGRRLWFGLKSSPCLCLSSVFLYIGYSEEGCGLD